MFVGIPVTRTPPAIVICCECKFCILVKNNSLSKSGLFGKLVSKSDSVIENPEDDIDQPCRLLCLAEFDDKFIVVAAHSFVFTPRLFPRFIFSRLLRFNYFKPRF